MLHRPVIVVKAWRFRIADTISARVYLQRPAMDGNTWEERYRQRKPGMMPEPARLLRDYEHLLTGGTALDIAAGEGQNGIFLASRGYTVTCVDRSSSAVALIRANAAAQGVTIEAVAADVLTYPIPEQAYDVILNFYFLERSLLPAIKAGLKKGGFLFFETYTIEQQRFNGPHNPVFLLQPNELLNACLDLFILFYHERIDMSGSQPRAVASLIGQKT
ncbi:MAG: class I SAM-dependent methyltransferase [Desulfobacterota bacterium]|nr:class I SAM-dependent methyltransferase [Thermodesulfobacteriota bacterium]